jgi:predicted SprT family Zn-dependent metalloprotease
MTTISGSSGFGRNVYFLTDMDVGETKAFPCEDEAQQRRVRKAAHNLNMRNRGYFSTRCKDSVIYVTRIR